MSADDSTLKSSSKDISGTDSEALAFDSWRSFWTFRNEVARQRRYIRSAVTERFLAAVASTAQARVSEIPQGWTGWRAAVAHDLRWEPSIEEEIPCAASSKRMIPWPDRAHEGRVNPKGIPCLYLATESETAMSEVRPWVGSLVSVAQFQTVRPLRVVDCSREHKTWIFQFEELAATERVRPVWADIDRAFSEPTTRSDDLADYAPTQVLAELFREQGYDGVVYKSAFGADGYNVALFDLNAAAMRTCSLYKVKSASYDFQHEDGGYTFTNAQQD